MNGHDVFQIAALIGALVCAVGSWHEARRAEQAASRAERAASQAFSALYRIRRAR